MFTNVFLHRFNGNTFCVYQQYAYYRTIQRFSSLVVVLYNFAWRHCAVAPWRIRPAMFFWRSAWLVFNQWIREKSWNFKVEILAFIYSVWPTYTDLLEWQWLFFRLNETTRKAFTKDLPNRASIDHLHVAFPAETDFLEGLMSLFRQNLRMQSDFIS